MRIDIDLLHPRTVQWNWATVKNVTCGRCGEEVCGFGCHVPNYVSPHDRRLPMEEQLWQAFRRDEALKAASHRT